MNDTEFTTNDDEKPPFFDTWQSIYLFVIASLFITIIAFYLLTISFD